MGRESRDRAVVPSAAELVEQLKNRAAGAEGVLTESGFEAVKDSECCNAPAGSQRRQSTMRKVGIFHAAMQYVRWLFEWLQRRRS